MMNSLRLFNTLFNNRRVANFCYSSPSIRAIRVVNPKEKGIGRILTDTSENRWRMNHHACHGTTVSTTIKRESIHLLAETVKTVRSLAVTEQECEGQRALVAPTCVLFAPDLRQGRGRRRCKQTTRRMPEAATCWPSSSSRTK